MRILLTGRGGQVGSELVRSLAAAGEVIATDRGSLDLTQPDLIRRGVRHATPDVIVNAAAYTAVDRAEAEPAQAMLVNGQAPAVLAEEAARLGALFVHFSTDYVFDGEKTTPYTEDDEPHPINVYGRSKLAGEVAIKQSGCRYLILRTSWVYSARGRNFVLAILRKARSEKEIRVVNDQFGAPTSAALIAEATTTAIKRCVTSTNTAGLYHVTARGETNWSGFAEAVLADLNEQATVVPISSSEFPSVARRPRYSVLDTRRFQDTFEVTLPHWREEQGRVLRDLKSAPD